MSAKDAGRIDDIEAVDAAGTPCSREGADEESRPEILSSLRSFTAAMAHELNNPLGAIMLAAQNAIFFRSAPGAGELIDRCLQDILRDARRCDVIVKRMRQLAGAAAGGRALCDMNAALQETAQRLQPEAAAANASLNLRLTGEPLVASINRLDLEALIENILRNAIECGEGGPLDVTIESRRSENRAQISVIDTGTGIAENDQQRLFEPFFTTKRSSGNLGLGLAIVRRVIQDYQGRVTIESKTGAGTRITVTLPLENS